MSKIIKHLGEDTVLSNIKSINDSNKNKLLIISNKYNTPINVSGFKFVMDTNTTLNSISKKLRGIVGTNITSVAIIDINKIPNMYPRVNIDRFIQDLSIKHNINIYY